MDRTILPKLEQILSGLKKDIVVTDENGNSMIPDSELRYKLPDNLSPGKMIRSAGRVYYVCSCAEDIVMMTIESGMGDDLEDTFRLIDALISAYIDQKAALSGESVAFRKVLLTELSLTEMDTLVGEYHIRTDKPRCAILLHIVQLQNGNAFEILSECLPRSEEDLLVNVDRHNVVLVKDTSQMEEVDELYQYAAAALETLLSEAALPVKIGIGDVVPDIMHLHDSYNQARRAIEIGRVFREDDDIYLYRSMLLERFLSTLPAETARHYHDLLFNATTNKLFSEEMLTTINMFFKKDLNLSDTARQLYIHRNTLVYRLDKIQREIGLDLRKFEDAVTFKMLREMEKCKNNQ